MSDALATYLHDHLAGSNFAIELLTVLRDKHEGEASRTAASVLPEIEKDREILQKIIDRVGSAPFDLKEAAAWVAEKASRLKLHSDDPFGLGTFEAIETLALGILGKLSLWKALQVSKDSRLETLDFDELCKRAEEQHAQVEACRLGLARVTFASHQPRADHSHVT